MFEINVTQDCPFTCPNCIRSDLKPPEDIFKAYIKKLVAVKTDMYLWLTGGEPMLYPDRVEEYLDISPACSMVTTGLVNINELIRLLKKYPQFRCNISVSGLDEYETTIRGVGCRGKDVASLRDNLVSLSEFGKRIHIVSVVYKGALETGEVFKNLEYVYTKYSMFERSVLWDRFADFTVSDITRIRDFLVNIKKEPISCFSKRTLCPAIFVDGKFFRIYEKKSPSFIEIEKCLDDPLGIIASASTLHNIGTINTQQGCDVYKYYPGCGGPECRFGYVPDCKRYWSQFIV